MIFIYVVMQKMQQNIICYLSPPVQVSRAGFKHECLHIQRFSPWRRMVQQSRRGSAAKGQLQKGLRVYSEI